MQNALSVQSGTVRKRTWTNRQGDTKVAWFADYHDQHGKRHRKTFATKEAAKVGLRDRDGLERRAEPLAEPNEAAIIVKDKALGCIEIGIFLGRSKQQAAYLCRTGQIPASKRQGSGACGPRAITSMSPRSRTRHCGAGVSRADADKYAPPAHSTPSGRARVWRGGFGSSPRTARSNATNLRKSISRCSPSSRCCWCSLASRRRISSRAWTVSRPASRSTKARSAAETGRVRGRPAPGRRPPRPGFFEIGFFISENQTLNASRGGSLRRCRHALTRAGIVRPALGRVAIKAGTLYFPRFLCEPSVTAPGARGGKSIQ